MQFWFCCKLSNACIERFSQNFIRVFFVFWSNNTLVWRERHQNISWNYWRRVFPAKKLKAWTRECMTECCQYPQCCCRFCSNRQNCNRQANSLITKIVGKQRCEKNYTGSFFMISLTWNNDDFGDISPFPRHWNTGLVSRGVSLTSWGDRVSLTLIGHLLSDGVTIKTPYGVDVLLHQLVFHPIFSFGLGKPDSEKWHQLKLS